MSGERPGVWVCIDGTEGAGKTTVTQHLSEEVPSIAVNEFSDAPFGDALRHAVQTSPHFISQSPLGQSLVFLGDFVELYESKIAPALRAGDNVFTDRGWLTKYAYQHVVLQGSMPADEADSVCRYVLAYVPKPDLTVLLRAPAQTIRSRLLARDGSCDDERMSFIEQAAAAADGFVDSDHNLRVAQIDASRARDAVFEDVMSAVRLAVSGS